MRRLLTFFFICTLTVLAARAESVRWENGDSGDPSDLQLIFDDCSPDGDPQVPRIPGLTLSLAGSSTQTTINNFNMSRSTILLYRVRAQGATAIKIPAFSVKTNKGSLTVPAFSGGTPKTAADANVLARLELGSPTVWAGEVFPLTYVLDVSRRSFSQLGSAIEWDSAPLVVEEWPKSPEVNSNTDPRLQISSKTRAYAKSPGPLTLNPASQLVNIQSGSIGFGLFQTPRIEQVSVTTPSPSVLVRPLPSPAPAGFSGAVGQFKVTSKVVPTNAAVGEPVTWTIELTGTGNWPDIAGLPQREVSKDFNIVQPQAKRTSTDGKLFDAALAEDVVLVPTRAGDYTLGPVNFVYFDPAANSYKTISAPKTTISIAPAAAAAKAAGAAETPATANTAASTAPQAKTELKVPAAPQGIPREPLRGSTTTMTPLRKRTLGALICAPFAAVIVLWGFLAVRRAQQTDPARPRREARERLKTVIAELRTADEARRAKLLLAWEHDAAVVWQLPHAAPPAHALVDAAWSKLWAEADRALYSTAATLPPDWCDRAHAALTGKTVPGFRAWSAFMPKNLLPFVAVLMVATLLTPFVRSEETAKADPAEAYRSGDFSAAQKAWEAAVSQHPTDAVARHNLSLALAQQDRWGEAEAQASASFVLHPRNPAASWQMNLTSEKAGFVPADLAGFLPPGPIQSLARLASPSGWQMAAIAAALLAAIAFGALLFGAYHGRSKLLTWSAAGTLMVAALLALSASASLHAYGLTADQRAVIVWRTGVLRSIPTEADTTQKTSALPAGTVALGEKTLLGWVRLKFDNGQTGWVRREEVVPLWRAPFEAPPSPKQG